MRRFLATWTVAALIAACGMGAWSGNIWAAAPARPATVPSATGQSPKEQAAALFKEGLKLLNDGEPLKGFGNIQRAAALDPDSEAARYLKAMAAAVAASQAPAAQESEADAKNRAAREQLDENLKEIMADNVGIEKVITYLRDNMGANIFINWPALQAAGIERTSPVSVSLREVPFRKALTTILAQVGGGKANLGYTIDDGIIVISTKADLQSAKYQVVRVFDIRDMLVMPASNANGAQREQLIKNLADTIKATVEPDSWKDSPTAGANAPGTLRELNGQLIINQTEDNQKAIFSLLQQLRETRSIQIAVESRLLIVSKDFLDDFRIGWDISLGAKPGGATTAPASQPATGPAIRNGGNAGQPVAASIIDNWTLTMLLQATQADRRTITITAPRETLFNGQAGKWDISDKMPVTVPPAPATPAAQPADLPVTISLNVTPTVSADRRYVIVSLDTLQIAPAHDKPINIRPADGKKPLVSIPDGGTLLINLGPIPGDDAKRVGLLLVRPNIIIHREIENDLFGVGYDKPTTQPATAPTPSGLP